MKIWSHSQTDSSNDVVNYKTHPFTMPTAAISVLVHNNCIMLYGGRLCTKMAAIGMVKRCMLMVHKVHERHLFGDQENLSITYYGLCCIILLLPPPGEEGHLDVDEGPIFILLQFTDDTIQNVFHCSITYRPVPFEKRKRGENAIELVIINLVRRHILY